MEHVLKQAEPKEPRHLDFTREVFKELSTFNPSEQCEVLNSLHNMLISKYECEQEELYANLENAKKRLAVIKQLNQSEPANSIHNY